MRKFKAALFSVFTAAILLTNPLPVLAEPGVLVTEAELNLVLSDPNTAVLDVSPAEVYAAGHIPGAINLQRSDLANPWDPVPSELLTVSQMERLFSRLGIQNGAALYIYSQTAYDATRLWWTLTHYGIGPVHVLNGNLQTWKDLGYGISQEIPNLVPSDFNLDPLKFQTKINTSTSQLRSSMSGNIQLIDNRSAAEFSGQILTAPAARRGRIPGAINIDWRDQLDGAGRLKSVDELRALYLQKGINEETPIIVYCHSGFQSSLNYFVLTQILDYGNVSIYDPSWVAWSRDLSLPIECDYSRFTIGSVLYDLRSEESTLDAAPYIREGRTYLPLRPIALAMGIRERDILWDGGNRTVTLTKGDQTVQLALGQKLLRINGVERAMDTSPEILELGRIMLPARALVEAFGGHILWDPVLRQALVFSHDDLSTASQDCGCAS